MKKLRIYVDTSVIGGCCDVEFSAPSQALVDLFSTGRAVLLASDLLLLELDLAPEEVRTVMAQMPIESIERVAVNEEAERLKNRYLSEGVVGEGSANDAFHVALATVARADMIVSWNFKHIVHYEKMRGFNAVNLKEGYGQLEIHAPPEVI